MFQPYYVPLEALNDNGFAGRGAWRDFSARAAREDPRAGLGTGLENSRRLARLSRVMHFLENFLEVFLHRADNKSSAVIKRRGCPRRQSENIPYHRNVPCISTAS